MTAPHLWSWRSEQVPPGPPGLLRHEAGPSTLIPFSADPKDTGLAEEVTLDLPLPPPARPTTFLNPASFPLPSPAPKEATLFQL